MNFLPVKGYEGLYEVSDSGIVRSLDRNVLGSDGVSYPFKGRELRQAKNKNTGYPVVSLWRDNQGTTHYVHRLVAQAHIPNPTELPEVNHIDGLRTNSHKDNLEWVSSSENSYHAVSTGLRVYENRLTYGQFVDCLFAVIEGESYASIAERVPYKVPFISVKLRKIAQELGIEADLDESLQHQRIIRARINGAKNQRKN